MRRGSTVHPASPGGICTVRHPEICGLNAVIVAGLIDPCAVPSLAADAVECCPTPTVISPWAEALRFHPIKGRWFKSSPRNQRKQRVTAHAVALFGRWVLNPTVGRRPGLVESRDLLSVGP